MEFRIPEPMKLEHDELHAALVRAIQAGGQTGAAAQAVADLLHPHFVKEEAYALPPLGLLQQLARGEVVPEMREVLAMTDALRVELDEMLAEHQGIVGALDRLEAAAKSEGKPEVEEFAAKLKLHAQTEEQVSYPTSLLIGEYVRLKLAAPVPA